MAGGERGGSVTSYPLGPPVSPRDEAGGNRQNQVGPRSPSQGMCFGRPPDGSRQQKKRARGNPIRGERRVFRRWFSAFCVEVFPAGSRGLGVEGGEVEVPEPDRGAHDPMAEGGHPPPAGARDLGHESVHMEAVEEAADLRTLPARVIGQLQRRGGQLRAEITIREAVHGVLATHEGREELLGIRAGHGIEGLGGPSGRSGGRGCRGRKGSPALGFWWTPRWRR